MISNCLRTDDLTLEEIKELAPWFEYYKTSPQWVRDYYDSCHFGCGFRPLTTRQKKEFSIFAKSLGRAFGDYADKLVLDIVEEG